MKSKVLGSLVLLDLVLISMWLAILIALNVSKGPIETFEQALNFATERHWLFYYVTYINAILFTVLGTAIYAGLYVFLRRGSEMWAAIGFVFAPIYGLLALGSYLSQLIAIPRLIEMLANPAYEATATVLLQHLIQMWPQSALQQIDQFSYAIGGIPGIIFGILLYRYSRPMRVAGGLLMLSGATGPFVGVGVIAGLTQLVTVSSMIGGILAMPAYLLLGVNLLRHGTATADKMQEAGKTTT
jgi:hypothetical protein